MTRIVAAVLILLAGFGGYVAGQARTVRPLPGGPTVYSGENFGFRAVGEEGDPTTTGKGWITGTFVIKVNGRWLEVRPGAAVVPITGR